MPEQIDSSDDITHREHAEAAVRKSEERLRLALSAGAMATWDWHIPTGDVTWNDEHFRMLGYEPGEVPPSYRTWAARIHPEDRAATEALVRASVEQGADYRAEFRALMRDGTVRWIEARARIECDAAGKPVRQYGVMIDITDRKRNEQALRESERLYRAIGESIDYGIWVCAPDGRNTYASESFLKLVGMTQEQCSNFGWGNVLHPDDAEHTIAAWQECVRTGGTWDIEHRMRGVDGRWHPILARGVPVRDERGDIVCWAGINLDISQLKQAEADLRDREAALREADNQKNRFLAVLSHELRNPLTPITNSLYILDRADPGSEQANRAKAVLARQVSHLTRLVDDLLDVTRIVSGKLRLQRARFDLAQLLRRTAEDHRTGFADAGVALDVRVGPEPVWMLGDESRMAQATGNLLANSSKFTSSGGRVVLALEVDPATSTGAVLVRDTGIGVHRRTPAQDFRTVRAGRQLPGTQQERPRARPGAREERGRTSRRDRHGPQRRPGARRGVRDPGAGGTPGRRADRSGRPRVEPLPVVSSARHRGQPGRGRQPPAHARARPATRSTWPTPAPMAFRRPGHSRPTWSSATSGSPGWTATRSPGRSGPTRRSDRRTSWRSPGTPGPRTGSERLRPASTGTWRSHPAWRISTPVLNALSKR